MSIVLPLFVLIFALCFVSGNARAVLLLILGAVLATALIGVLMVTAVGGWSTMGQGIDCTPPLTTPAQHNACEPRRP